MYNINQHITKTAWGEVCNPISIETVKRINAEMGFYFFTPDTMRFFNSRVCEDVFAGKGGWYFVTSEKFDAYSERLYTVRCLRKDGSIDDVGKFQQFRNARTAKAYAKMVSEQ